MKTALRPARIALAAAALAAALVAGAATAASADTAAPSADAQQALADQYSSMSGALIGLYAKQSQQSVSDYLASQQILLSPPALPDPVAGAAADPAGQVPQDLPADPASPTTGPASPTTAAGTSPTGTPSPALTLPTLPALGTAQTLGTAAGQAKPVTAATVADLNRQLSAAGLSLDTKGYSSLDALARSVAAKSNTLDGAVTLAGAKWMSSLSTLRTPALATPKAQTQAVPGLPKASLVFGLFADKSLAHMMSASPDLFSSVGKSGVGSATLAKSWNSSMQKVYNASSGDFTKMLPDPCTGGMLAVMATGDPAAAKKVAGSGCSSACVAGGLYLNSQTTALFAPGTGKAAGNPYSSLWNSSTLNGLQPWQQKQLLAQNPQLANQLLADNRPSASAACSASSKASSAALGATLPGVFGQLRTK